MAKAKKGELRRQFFIAVLPPQHVIDQIAALCEGGNAEWDWKRPADYHISLAMVGQLTDGQLKKLKQTLQELDHQAFEVAFTGLTFYYKDPYKEKSRNHVLWAAPDNTGRNELRDLQSKIAELLHQRRFKTMLKDFDPHLTVARPPPEAGEETKEFAKANSEKETDSWRCGAICILESIPARDPDHPDANGGQGSKYRKVAEIPLRP